MAITFKEFLSEEKQEMSIIKAADIYLKHCTQWANVSHGLFRTSDSQFNAPVVGEPRTRQKESLGGTEQMQRWLRGMKSWEGFPDRRKSIFCSASKNGLFGANEYVIYPFDDTPLAVVPEDFNEVEIKIGSERLNLANVHYTIDTIYAEAIRANPNKSIPEKIEALRSIDLSQINTHARTINLIKAIVEHGESLFSPAAMGARLFESPKQFEWSSKSAEVWFSGKYLQVPIEDLSVFIRAVKS